LISDSLYVQRQRRDEAYTEVGIALCVFINYSQVVVAHITMDLQRLAQGEIGNFDLEFTRSNMALRPLGFSITMSSLETGAQKQTLALSRVF
jgi:hypothetical protein